MTQEKREYKILPSLVLIGIGIFIISVVSAWTVPTAAPPGGNVSTPINVSATAQTKAGDLTTNGFFYESGTRMQKRVSSTCGAGSSIRAIDANGNVTCETDDDTDTDDQVFSCTDAVANFALPNDWKSVGCPEGYTVTGGGCSADTACGRIRMDGNGWNCGACNNTLRAVYARCCKISN